MTPIPDPPTSQGPPESSEGASMESARPLGPHTIVVGGGLAGLACAAALGLRGHRVTLLESRNRLGGRASSFLDATTGEWLDNCQHVTLGCCTNFAKFCRDVGIDHFFAREDRLIFVGPQGTRHTFAASPLPAPLHLAPAFARLSYLSWSDRLCLGRGLRTLARTSPDALRGVRFDQWLIDHRQTPAVIEKFWHVVLVSALSETVDRIDAFHARKVFVDGFLANRLGWEVWLPTVPLDRLYGQELKTWLVEHGVTLRLNAGVKRIVPDGMDATGTPTEASRDTSGTTQDIQRQPSVELRTGERLTADSIVLAVPQNLVVDLVPQFAEWWNRSEGPARLATAPISSVHLWYDRPITDDRHITFVGRTSQWLFNRAKIHPAESAGPTAENGHTAGVNWYGQVVISASHDVAARPAKETIDHVVQELAELLPAARDAQLVRSRLVTEHRAVLAMLPGVDRFRPGPESPVPGLFLAGDWIQTGWPSTMEGAVRSGWLAAEAVLRRSGHPESLLQPDLPRARLSKWLFGL